MSLNQIATALGFRLLEDLVCERLSSGIWLRLDYSSAGLPEIRSLAAPAPKDPCPVCERAGTGTLAFDKLPKYSERSETAPRCGKYRLRTKNNRRVGT